jgi:hypothetical protein
LRVARVVDVGKEKFAREIAAAFDRAREAPIVDRDRMLHAALAAELQADALFAFDSNVART